MKYALIGCGRISTNHIKAAVANNLEIVAVCDVIPERMEEVLAKHGLENDKSILRYTDYKKLIAENIGLQLISIATESGVISFSVITVRAYIRVEVVDRATLCVHQFAYGKRGAFTIVVDIVFISHAELQYLSSVKRFFMLIKQISQTAYGVFGHFVVNHHRRLYHRSMETVLTRLP